MPATLSLTDVRWSLRRDLPEYVALDGAWTEADFLARLRERNCIGMSACRDDAVVGFAVYELHPSALKLVRFAAADDRAAERLLAKLLSKTNSHRRPWLDVSFRDAVRMGGAALGPDVLQFADRVMFADLPRARPAWRTDAVRWMCAGEHYPPLPILADALEEAGCECAELLSLFRADGDVAALVYEDLREVLTGTGNATPTPNGSTP